MLLPVSNELYTAFALHIEKLLSKTGFDLGKIPKDITNHAFFVQMLQFLQTHKQDLRYIGGETFQLKELDETVLLGPSSFFNYKPFFDVKGKIRFFKNERQVFAEVKDHVFAIPFPFGVLQLDLVFIRDWYGTTNLRGAYVIDVGAFIGDTAVYFASKGARKVLAFEAAPPTYRLAKQNILLNHVESVVQLENEAVSDRNGFVSFNYRDSPPSSSSYLSSNAKAATFTVKSISFSDVMSHSDYVDILKLNCEGAEHQILRQAYEQNLLDKIGSIMVEIHGPEEKIKGYLKNTSYRIVRERYFAEGLRDILAVKD